MARKKAEPTAAELLGEWTDSDTAMQIVGTSLGVFGSNRLDPEVVLARETPLRNALFDVLLNLVEGGALDVRPTDDGHYAFRWRADYAVGALNPATATTVDIEAPTPHRSELAQLTLERDAALERANGVAAIPAAPAPPPEVEVVEADAVARALERAFQVPSSPATIDLVAFEDAFDDAYDDEYDDYDDEPAAPDNGVVYLAPAPAPVRVPGGKWSAYSLERPRSRASRAERVTNQG